MSRLTTKARRAATRRRAWQWNYRRRYFIQPFIYVFAVAPAARAEIEARIRVPGRLAEALAGLYGKARA